MLILYLFSIYYPLKQAFKAKLLLQCPKSIEGIKKKTHQN